MTNTENLQKLIDKLKTLSPWNFDMQVWSREDKPHCGTIACIGGWGEVLAENDGGLNYLDWLGISPSLAHSLFYAEPGPSLGQINALQSPEHPTAHIICAIKVLEHLRDTGKVDWDRAYTRTKEELKC